MASETLVDARRVIEKRLEQLRGEVKELEDALRHLGGRAPTRRRATASRRGPTRTGRRTPQRSEQFKRALAKTPGARVSEVAKKMGISSQQGHGIAKRLREKGEIKKQGKGYALKN